MTDPGTGTSRARHRRASAALVAIAIAILLLLPACAAGPPPVSEAANAPGLFTGFWHGLILPITFVVSLFNDGVGVYESQNGGHLYDLGFVLGAGGLALPGIFARRGR
jgi:hypothetical protein